MINNPNNGKNSGNQNNPKNTVTPNPTTTPDKKPATEKDPGKEYKDPEHPHEYVNPSGSGKKDNDVNRDRGNTVKSDDKKGSLDMNKDKPKDAYKTNSGSSDTKNTGNKKL